MKHQALIIHEQSPFKESVERQIKTTTDSGSNMILNEEVTIVRKRQYLNMPWVKLTQDKEKMSELSPHACKILIYIALNLTWNQEKMKISMVQVGITRPMFKRAMLELLSARLIANTGVREWYWLNVGILIMGTITKHE